jgi:hypothetical protein
MRTNVEYKRFKQRFIRNEEQGKSDEIKGISLGVSCRKAAQVEPAPLPSVCKAEITALLARRLADTRLLASSESNKIRLESIN